MLKTLSLGQAEGSDASKSDDSENRMLRALEAMSQGSPAHGDATAPSVDHRKFGSPQNRDSLRKDQPSAGNKPRHRFVRDGEIPVVHMSQPRLRDAAASTVQHDQELQRLQQLLAEERQKADLAIERLRAEMNAQVKSLQTKLAHSELTLAEAVKLAEARYAEISALQFRLAQSEARAEPGTQEGPSGVADNAGAGPAGRVNSPHRRRPATIPNPSSGGSTPPRRAGGPEQDPAKQRYIPATRHRAKIGIFSEEP